MLPLPGAASPTGSPRPKQKRGEGTLPIRGSANSLVYRAEGLFEDFFVWPPWHGCLNLPSLSHRLWQWDKCQLLKVSLKFNLPTSSPTPKRRQRRTRGIGISKWWVGTWWNIMQPRKGTSYRWASMVYLKKRMLSQKKTKNNKTKTKKKRATEMYQLYVSFYRKVQSRKPKISCLGILTC